MDVGKALSDEAAAGRSDRPRSGNEPTREELYREATRLGVKGRSRMSKEQLRDAVARARRRR